MIKHKNFALIGAILMIISISLGALGAHALSEILSEDRLRSFLTANQYLSIHGLAFLILSLFPETVRNSVKLIFIGLLLFSGSIFTLITLGHQEIEYPKIIGLITPIGGVLMIVGWCILAFQIAKNKSK